MPSLSTEAHPGTQRRRVVRGVGGLVRLVRGLELSWRVPHVENDDYFLSL